MRFLVTVPVVCHAAISVGSTSQGPRLPVASSWFVTEQLPSPSPGYELYRTREVHETVFNDGFEANYYFLRGEHADLILDVGYGFESFAQHLLQEGLLAHEKPLHVVGSHEHWDHSGGLRDFEPLAQAQIMLGRADADAVERGDLVRTGSMEVRSYASSPAHYWNAAPCDANTFRAKLESYVVQARVDRRLVHGDALPLGPGVSLEVLELPGHTRGSIGLYDRSTKVLFSGDAVYSGLLLDGWTDSSKAVYSQTMEYLRHLEVAKAYPGHSELLSHAEFLAVIDCYLSGQVYCPARVNTAEQPIAFIM